MPKASTFALRLASQMIDSDWIPMGTNAGENVRLPVSEAKQLLGITGSATINAYNEVGATREIKIQAAINRAVSTGADRVFIPTSMLPYDAALVTFNGAVQMVREGGDFTVWDVKAYGASGLDNPIYDDRAAIQAAIDGAEGAWTQRTIAVNDVGSLSYSMPEVKLPTGYYRIGGSLDIFLFANIVAEDGTFILATSNTFDIITTTDETGYVVRIKGIHFIGGRIQINLVRTNMDASMNIIEDCAHSAGDYTYPAIYLDTRSASSVIRRPRCLSRPYFLEIEVCDTLQIQGGWINGYAYSGDSNHQHKPADTASRVNRGAELLIRDVLFVPEPDTGGADPAFTKTRWVDNYYNVFFDNCHFGSENAGFPIVYNFGTAYSNTHPYLSGTSVRFKGGIAYAGVSTRADRGLVVCKTNVPAQISVEDLTGPTDSKIVNTAVMVESDLTTPRTLADWLTDNTDGQNPKIQIRIVGNATWGTSSTDIVPAELFKYTEYEVQGTNGSGNTRFISRLIAGMTTENGAGGAIQTSGLSFPAVMVASGDANTMDFFKKSSFSPIITFGGASTGMTFSSAPEGRMTRTASCTHVSLYWAFSNKGSATGNLLISALPFDAENDVGAFSTVHVRGFGVTYTGLIQGYIPLNTATIVLEQMTEAGTVSALTHANFSNTSEVMVSVTYFN